MRRHTHVVRHATAIQRNFYINLQDYTQSTVSVLPANHTSTPLGIFHPPPPSEALRRDRRPIVNDRHRAFVTSGFPRRHSRSPSRRGRTWTRNTCSSWSTWSSRRWSCCRRRRCCRGHRRRRSTLWPRRSWPTSTRVKMPTKRPDSVARCDGCRFCRGRNTVVSCTCCSTWVGTLWRSCSRGVRCGTTWPGDAMCSCTLCPPDEQTDGWTDGQTDMQASSVSMI